MGGILLPLVWASLISLGSKGPPASLPGLQALSLIHSGTRDIALLRSVLNAGHLSAFHTMPAPAALFDKVDEHT